MIHKIRHILRNKVSKPFFILGTGRSGTHWIGYTLAEHPEIRATIEASPMFKWSTTMALNPQSESHLFPKLIKEYKRQLANSAPRHYLDKSHPNIWIADKLKNAFPNALFIGIERNPFATVASMMKHHGVSEWQNRWRDFPIPNRFLGIDKKVADIYEQLPFPSKCAMRWLAHHKRMIDLKKILKDSMHVIIYESLATNTKLVISELQSFLKLVRPITMPKIKAASLDKWRNQLTKEELKQISDVIGYAPD